MKRKDFINLDIKDDIVQETAKAIVKYHTKHEVVRLKNVWDELLNATWRTMDKITTSELTQAINIASTIDYTKDKGVEDANTELSNQMD